MKCTSFWKGSGKETLVLWLGQAGMGLQVVLNRMLEKRAFSTGRVLEAKVERVYARAGSEGTPVGPAWDAQVPLGLGGAGVRRPQRPAGRRRKVLEAFARVLSLSPSFRDGSRLFVTARGIPRSGPCGFAYGERRFREPFFPVF